MSLTSIVTPQMSENNRKRYPLVKLSLHAARNVALQTSPFLDDKKCIRINVKITKFPCMKCIGECHKKYKCLQCM